jgi:hypothetical protein
MLSLTGLLEGDSLLLLYYDTITTTIYVMPELVTLQRCAVLVCSDYRVFEQLVRSGH